MKRENVLKAARQLLDEIRLSPRANTTEGAGQPRSQRVTVSLPADIMTLIDCMGDARSHHFERALRLYALINSERK